MSVHTCPTLSERNNQENREIDSHRCVCWWYVPVPGCGSLVIQNYASTTPVQPWVKEALIAFSSYREMKAVHACPLQNVCGPYLPVPGCGSLVISKYECTPLSNLEWEKQSGDQENLMMAVDICLQESSKKLCADVMYQSPAVGP